MLADRLTALRDRALEDLLAAHDYYLDTKIAWRMARRSIASGVKFSIKKVATGTVITSTEFIGKSREYIAVQIAEATFQQYISIFENFYFDLLSAWLFAYPQSLGTKNIDLKTALALGDMDSLVRFVVHRKVNDMVYDRPAAWFAYLEELARLGCPTEDEIGRTAEAKASRDVLIHNRGIANKTYESKAGKFARYKEGERIVVSEKYHRDTWELIRKVIADISNAASEKSA